LVCCCWHTELDFVLIVCTLLVLDRYRHFWSDSISSCTSSWCLLGLWRLNVVCLWLSDPAILTPLHLVLFWCVYNCEDWRLYFGLFFLVSSLEALVLAYGLNASTWICFLWFENTSHGYASPLVPCFLLMLTCHVVYMLHLVFLVLAQRWRVSILYLLEPWSCCFMVPLVWSLFNIWSPSIEDFGSSLHFFFFWISLLFLGYPCYLFLVLLPSGLLGG